MALAQQPAWLQIEARPDAAQGAEAARGYARRIENVAGFRLGRSNWYAVAIGPLPSGDAARRLRSELRRSGLIPADSFVTDGATFNSPFWPPEASQEAAAETPVDPEAENPAETSPETADGAGTRAAEEQATAGDRSEARPSADVSPAPTVPPAPEETLPQARRSEQALDAQARRQLQTALRWAGVYDGPIDAAFGAGTRAAMQAWQEANGRPATGVLTSAERQTVIAAYRQLVEELGLEQITDAQAGIALRLPAGLVAFDRYQAPFAHYEPLEEGAPYKVILISQEGDRTTLGGLYEIMQTLEVVPETGPRALRARDFSLVGEGAELVSQTEVMLRDGAVKGFTLIWPSGDEPRRRRVVDAMLESFEALPAVLPSAAPLAETGPRLDLLAGLEVRRPERVRSGVFVDAAGSVVTAAQVVQGCGRVTLGDDLEATLVDGGGGGPLALLRPAAALVPRGHAALAEALPQVGAPVLLSGHSFEGALGAPSLTSGTLEAQSGLGGEPDLMRLTLPARPGDAGGPLLDTSGAMIGVLLPEEDGARSLPRKVAIAAGLPALAALLERNGIDLPRPQADAPRPTRAELERRSEKMTVLVNCWN